MEDKEKSGPKRGRSVVARFYQREVRGAGW